MEIPGRARLDGVARLCSISLFPAYVVDDNDSLASSVRLTSVSHLPNIQIHPLPRHPPPPLLIHSPISSLSRWPIRQLLRTRAPNYLRNTMPTPPRLALHNNRTARPQPQHHYFPFRLAYDENRVTSQTHANESATTRLSDVAVRTQRIPRRVDIQNRGFGSCRWEDCA
jgi:hypothetical protein